MAWEEFYSYICRDTIRDCVEEPYSIPYTRILHTTDKAALYAINDNYMFWCPKSIIIKQTKSLVIVKSFFKPLFLDINYAKSYDYECDDLNDFNIENEILNG